METPYYCASCGRTRGGERGHDGECLGLEDRVLREGEGVTDEEKI